MMLIHENFIRRFDLVPVLAPFRDFPKVVAAFLLIYERKHERFEMGGGGQMIFQILFFPYRRNDKKWNFFPEPEATKT